MSIFTVESFPCPECAEAVSFMVCASVNADRRPDLRDEIIDGTFQRGTCEKCGNSFRIDPEFTYFDMERKQWILVQPAADAVNWTSLEKEAQETFDLAYGENTGPIAREIGRDLQVRVTFGWPALKEKLLCNSAGLSDSILEIVKLVIVRGSAESPMSDDNELRLTGVTDEGLEMMWLNAANGTPLESIKVPLQVYKDVAADTESFADLQKTLEAGPYVDINRMLIATE